MPPCVADDAGAPDPVVGVAVDMAVHPQVRATPLDDVRQVRGVAPGQMGMPVWQAFRVGGVVGDDHGGAVVGPGELGIDEGPRRPM